MNTTIEEIIEGVDTELLCEVTVDRLFRNGPVSTTDLEILSYLSIYQPEVFKKHENSIINYMGLSYKNSSRDTLKEVIFGQYSVYIRNEFGRSFTPVQANIVKGINKNSCFSFSAPTSTGKSFVFMDLISKSKKDVVVVVPSRALINEYFLKLNDLITDKSTNVLTFVDKINTLVATRNVFIVTPERCRELFKRKDNFDVDLFLFDEAQLSDEESKRGLYFDSIVRRAQKSFPNSKFVFAHPFVKNPEAQIEKNHFDRKASDSVRYIQRNVGQIFLAADKEQNYFHFGIDAARMGRSKVKCSFDPLEQSITKGGAVLIYLSKSKIYRRDFLNDFSKYINLCKEISDPQAEEYISELKEYTGGDTIANKDHYSLLIALMKRGIVVHHGSLPLKTRLIIENFTRSGFCRICFATSTLEQGINMPFDVVYLDRLEASKPLSVMNLIGRAGRSTHNAVFDFGYVIISSISNISKFRSLFGQEIELDPVSSLEKQEAGNDDYSEFKEAILNGTFSDEYNLTPQELAKVTRGDVDSYILAILDLLFRDDQFIDVANAIVIGDNRLALYDYFSSIYSSFLGRELSRGEKNVLTTAIQIILWRVQGRTFKNICWSRYAYASKSTERSIEKNTRRSDSIMASFITGYNDLPDSNLQVYSLFPAGTKAKEVDYDLIMYDTYDYIDKLIGFKLSDIYFATLVKYYERTADERANKLSRIIKYGTDNERHIWMLRYGLTFEDIEIFDRHIDIIDEQQILFNESIYRIPDNRRGSISRYL